MFPFPSNRGGLDDALKRPVVLAAHVADLRQVRFRGFLERFSARLASLRVGEAVVAVTTPEARVARLLAALHAPEERLERQVHASRHVLKHLRMNALEFRYQ